MRNDDENSAIPAERWIAILKYRGMDAEAVMVAQRRNMEAMMQASSVVAKGIEDMASRHATMVRDTVDRLGNALPDPRQQHTIGDVTRHQLDFSRSTVESALSNFQELSDMVWQCNRQAYELVNRSLLDSLQSFLKVLPGGQAADSAAAKPPAKPKK